MLNYAHQFFKSRVLFYTLYPSNEVGDPYFFPFRTQVTHCLTAVKILKRSIDWKILVRTSLNKYVTKNTVPPL